MWRVVAMMPRTKPQAIQPDSNSSVRWDDVAGADEAKDELREVVEFLREPERFAALGARVPKGILLYGPPGTGKTLLAKAVAHESRAAFFSQSASSFVEMFAGVGASRIRKLFETARKHAPAIVFIDELDAVGAKRTGASFNREQDQTLNQLLVELDGFVQEPGVVVIAASNRLDALDAALLRPGRFDRQVLVGVPDLRGRREILAVHTRASRWSRGSTWSRSRARRPAWPAPTWRTSRTRRPSTPAAAGARGSTATTSTGRSSASSPACRRSA